MFHFIFAEPIYSVPVNCSYITDESFFKQTNKPAGHIWEVLPTVFNPQFYFSSVSQTLWWLLDLWMCIGDVQNCLQENRSMDRIMIHAILQSYMNLGGTYHLAKIHIWNISRKKLFSKCIGSVFSEGKSHSHKYTCLYPFQTLAIMQQIF